MKEKPILLNTEMVRAVLDGRKMQTRRVMKVQPHAGVRNSSFVKSGIEDGHGKELVCPFGEVGDRLWVREKTKVIHILNDKKAFVAYLADGEEATVPVPDRLKPIKPGYFLSNGCYREASRITLEITGVRVERLNNISEADARADGVEQLRGGFWRHYQPAWTQHQLSARGSFVTLWKSIYGEESWQANPWVWVIDFKRVEE